MKQFVIPVLVAASAATFVASPAVAQLGIAPGARQQDPAGEPKLAELVQQLRTAEDWWPAAKGLVDLARTQQMAVLTELSAIARTSADKNVASRGRAVIEQVVAAHGAGEKRSEIRARFRALDDAIADLRAALGEVEDGALKQAAGQVQQSLQKLRESVAADQALDPKPLRVPAGTRRRVPAPEPAGGEDPVVDEDGYRMIEVEGKNVLVPKRDLPEGMEFEASFENGSLVIKRYPNGRKQKAEGGSGGKGGGKGEKAPQQGKQPS